MGLLKTCLKDFKFKLKFRINCKGCCESDCMAEEGQISNRDSKIIEPATDKNITIL